MSDDTHEKQIDDKESTKETQAEGTPEAFQHMTVDALWAAMHQGQSIEASDNGAPQEDSAELPEVMPIFPVRQTVVFPYMLTPLQTNREKSIRVIEKASSEGAVIAITTQRDPQIDEPGFEDLYPAATAAKVLKTLKLPDGSINILVQGLRRVTILELTQTEPYLEARIENLTDTAEKSIELEGLIRNAQGLFQKIVNLTPYLPDEMAIAALNIDEPEKLADFIASSINLSIEEKIELLGMGNVLGRFQRLTVLLNREVEIVETGAKIQSQVRDEVDKTQREYYLRRQLELIQEELGQGDEHSQEIAELRKKIEEAHMTAEAKEEADRELDRLAKMHPAAAEYTVSRSYLDWLINIPWAKVTDDNLDIKAAEEILNEDHHGLLKIKDRILEYLAVRKLKADMKGPILCFIGPPGVGKTSLGQSIARALGRKFVRISLGGIHDEAEIRGHRRTYIGALPGKIMQGLRKAGTKNPVFMLDEIDKVGSDYRGDPSSALLEVLDPAQNGTFQDHYLGVSFDLSQVMFVTTANLLDPIPPALRDRMEVLELPGYTEEEKLAIAKGFLIRRQLENHGITPEELEIEDSAVLELIQRYTREAGVRNLDREIANICRKVARQFATSDQVAGEGLFESGAGKVIVSSSDIKEYLGAPRYSYGLAGQDDEVGVVTGLTWTPVGGDIIFIEVALVEGRGALTLTGRLGETMQESAKAAMTYARSRAADLGYPANFYRRLDIHIHVPEGAIPKDGPSAGVTMATALISALTGRPVRKDVAMTGEITLRGKVLPIGGVKEKVLAAHRAGIKTILLPAENEKDVTEIPEHIRKELDLRLMKNIDDILKAAIDWKAPRTPPPGF